MDQERPGNDHHSAWVEALPPKERFDILAVPWRRWHLKIVRRGDIAVALPAHIPRVLATVLLFAVVWGPWRESVAGAPASAKARPFQSIRMIDASTGWALAGPHCVLRTEDGGVHWRNVTPPTMPPTVDGQEPAAFSLTSLAAWVAVSSPTSKGSSMTGPVQVFRTADGGHAWRSVTFRTGDVFQITFVNPRTGWLIAYLTGGMMSDLVEIFRTLDGGMTWVKVASAGDETMPPGVPSSGLPRSGKKSGIGFVNATTGWLAGYTPQPDFVYLYETHDGGRTWRRQDLPRVQGRRGEDIVTLPPTFFSPQRGVLPTRVSREKDSGTVVYLTRDGGSTWRPTSMAPAAAYGHSEAYQFLDADRWWIIGDAGLLSTSDGGRHWEPRARPDVGESPGLSFASANVGWAFSKDRAVLFHTVDGGRRWSPLPYTVTPVCAR